MTLRILLAALHLTGLGVGLGAVWARARGFQGTLDAPGLRRLFAADSWWGLAAVLWIGTGLWRLLAGIEKPTPYYLHNHVFWLKMAALAAILLLEISPMVALIKWRILAARGASVDVRRAADVCHDQLCAGGPGPAHGCRRNGDGAWARERCSAIASKSTRRRKHREHCLHRGKLLSFGRHANRGELQVTFTADMCLQDRDAVSRVQPAGGILPTRAPGAGVPVDPEPMPRVPPAGPPPRSSMCRGRWDRQESVAEIPSARFRRLPLP